MSVFQEEVLNPIEDAMEGRVLKVPIHLDRVKDVLSIRKKIYTVVAGGTGSGKTSLVDDMYVLQPYELWKAWKDKTDITYKVLYRSMERTLGQKLTKWACWKLYMDYNILLDSDTLLGYRKSKISREVWDAVVSCRDWADELLDYVDIRDGRTTPDDVNKWITSHALRNGTLYIANDIGIYEAKTPHNYIDLFSEDKFITLKTGDKELVAYVKHNNTDLQMRQGSRKYFPNKPKEITIIIEDHVGKIVAQPDALTDKAKIDKLSSYNSDFRDIFEYSPVAVSQINRAVADINRIKHSNGDLSPILDDVKGTGNLVEDCDLLLTLFNPYRYKSFDDNGFYKGYNIRDMMVNPWGYNRYRLLSILKNSYGIDDVDYGLKFMGEFNYFSTLPKPGIDGATTPEIEQVYRDIQNGK